MFLNQSLIDVFKKKDCYYNIKQRACTNKYNKKDLQDSVDNDCVL